MLDKERLWGTLDGRKDATIERTELKGRLAPLTPSPETVKRPQDDRSWIKSGTRRRISSTLVGTLLNVNKVYRLVDSRVSMLIS